MKQDSEKNNLIIRTAERKIMTDSKLLLKKEPVLISKHPSTMNHIFLKIIVTIFITCLTLLFSQKVSCADTPISYWYSDENKIGHWASTPSISRIKLNGEGSFFFEEGYTSARSQWSGAGIGTISNGTSTQSSIVCWGGNAVQLVNANIGVSASELIGVNGVTHCSSTFQSNLNYNGTLKTLRNITPNTAKIYIVSNNNSLAQMKNTFTHELGHALGWFGHSSLSNDIMYTYGTSYTILTSRDKNHLVQVY